VKGKDNCNADCLSRLPNNGSEMSTEDIDESARSEINAISQGSELCLNLKLIAEKTQSEEFLANLYYCISNGWKTNYCNCGEKRADRWRSESKKCFSYVIMKSVFLFHEMIME
jgi:hypothetical protein